MSTTLQDQRVILLGASSGIGLATARAAAAEGAKVIIVSGNPDRLAAALSQLPKGSEACPVDLGREENIRKFFAGIGQFDHLVYTAGENLNLEPLGTTVIEDARSFFNLRFWSAVACVKYGAPLLNPGGSIGLTSGTAGIRPGKGWSMASAICGAMEGFVRAMAVELAPIRVNCVVPGVIRTNLWNSMPEANREGLFTAMATSLPAGRIGEAEDVARAFLYLMQQSFGTGQCLLVDGGTVLV
ncbi:MAG TPA: SDR family oxidoreductase [Puia sp.]|jgi:NAD(P)-dependent dehydrogenase (short-subunit alcohol dehydrogenase family)|nr:SDR family oxidoreductase [Puia sp.]